jgi:serine/threonine protein phosphatase PrpC
MIDRWYYVHAGKTLGPVTAAQLRQLVVNGRLHPSDLIWPEGREPSQAVPAQAAMPIAEPPPTLDNKPDWLDDLRAATAEPKTTQVAPAKPDWLDDVRAAEEEEQEFISLEWDGDNANVEEEMAKEILDELEEVSDEGPMAQPSAPAKPAGRAQRLVLGSATTRGRVRDRNEDSLLVQQYCWSNRDRRQDVALIVVADGMGGHQAGDRASGLVIRAFGGVLTPVVNSALNGEAPPTAAVLAETLDRGLQEANRLVLQTAKDNPDCKGMGSTAVAVLIWNGHAFISLAGDCRVYHWRGGQLTQLTRDQTLVARMVELGQLTPEEALRHPRRNEVIQAVGKPGRLDPGRFEQPLQRGDWLVACCDGLYAHVDDPMLSAAIGKAGTASELAQRLIDLANQGGGSDNCTVVAVHCPL